MPQVFHVLCCYNCGMFQVHQVKKSKKWQCKVCGEKQSLKKAFRVGSASECRLLVQDLNMKMGEKKENVLDIESVVNNSFEESGSDSENTQKLYGHQFIEESNFYDENCSAESDNNLIEELFSQENDRCYASPKDINAQEGDSDINAGADYLVCVNTSSNNQYKKRNVECLEEEAIFDEKLVNIFNEPKKCRLENTLSIPKSLPVPSIKKNQGFQMIKNAASKLN